MACRLSSRCDEQKPPFFPVGINYPSIRRPSYICYISVCMCVCVNIYHEARDLYIKHAVENFPRSFSALTILIRGDDFSFWALGPRTRRNEEMEGKWGRGSCRNESRSWRCGFYLFFSNSFISGHRACWSDNYSELNISIYNNMTYIVIIIIYVI